MREKVVAVDIYGNDVLDHVDFGIIRLTKKSCEQIRAASKMCKKLKAYHVALPGHIELKREDKDGVVRDSNDRIDGVTFDVTSAWFSVRGYVKHAEGEWSSASVRVSELRSMEILDVRDDKEVPIANTQTGE